MQYPGGCYERGKCLVLRLGVLEQGVDNVPPGALGRWLSHETPILKGLVSLVRYVGREDEDLGRGYGLHVVF